MSETTNQKPGTEKADPVQELVMPDSVTIDEGGGVLCEHHDGFDWPGELTFKCVNDFVHDAGREHEELQYLCLGLASKLEHERGKRVGLLDELTGISCLGELSKLLREHGLELEA